MLGNTAWEVTVVIKAVPLTELEEETTTAPRVLPETKRIYRCSLCGLLGRNIRTHQWH